MACSYSSQTASGVVGQQAAVYPIQCPNTRAGAIEQYPVGMGYIPWQQWQQTYPLEKGLQRGTIFPDLDLTFHMGRCR